jgi:hypothetical protein
MTVGAPSPPPMQTARSGSFTAESWQICIKARRLLGYEAVKRAAYVPFWAWQFVIGTVVVLLAVSVFAILVGAALRVPSNFLDEVGRTVSRVAPQPAPDVSTEEQLKKVIVAMPQGKLRVATVDAQHGQVVFTITADRAAVHAVVQPGDELRISKDGNVEIVPTGIPGLLDQLGRAMEDLKKKWFGN